MAFRREILLRIDIAVFQDFVLGKITQALVPSYWKLSAHDEVGFEMEGFAGVAEVVSCEESGTGLSRGAIKKISIYNCWSPEELEGRST